jgi:type I restriction enzyme S subunit
MTDSASVRSEGKATATKDGAKPGLVPKLRFPEFRDAKAWKQNTIGAVCQLKAGDFVSPSAIAAAYTEDSFPCYGGNGLRGYVRSFTHDGTHVVIGRQGALCGNVNLFHGRFHATEHALIVTPQKGFSTDWLYFALGKLNLNRFSIGQAQPGLSVGRLNDVTLATPPEEAEQNRIAECLGSLDERMALQSRKVNMLKNHKKGLIQQLFPREGETQPRLRFPEFQNAGVWNEQSIGDFGQVVTGSTPSTLQPAFYGGGIPFVSPVDISDARFVDHTKTTLTSAGFAETRPIRAGSVLFVCIGSTIGKVAQNVHDCATNQQTNAVVPTSKYSDGFVYFALLHASDRLASLAGKQAVPIINKSLFSSVRLLVPKLDEQKRIADCLSSLDALITVESQKREALKTHKKGLIQQLFPSLAEV